uniref:CSON011127 protein n=1 Tax=Culicoides sonorensis TaxID=179676 RepID=A0A336LIW6_CULSO
MENGNMLIENAPNENDGDHTMADNNSTSNSIISQSPPEQAHPAQQNAHQPPPGTVQQFPPQNQFPPRFGAPQGMPGPHPGMPGPPRPMGPNNELWIETKTDEGKSYYYHAISRQTTWVRPTGPNVQVMSQMEVENMQKQQMMKREGMPPAMGMPPGGQMPPFQGPPFGAPPFFNGPPPFGLPPPNFAQQQPQQPQQAYPWGNIHPQQWLAIKVKDDEIDPQLLAKAAEWTEHKAPDGRPYFYNASKNESVWEKPEVMRQVEELKAAAANKPKTANQGDGKKPFDFPDFDGKMAAEEERKKKQEAEKRKKEQEEKEKVKKPLDKSRPISSTPIAGTPWCVVWTGDGRVFFYNPSTRTSLWERPAELANRADVDKAMKTLPEALLNQNASVTKEETPQKPVIQILETKTQGKKRSESESSGDSVEEVNTSINKKFKAGGTSYFFFDLSLLNFIFLHENEEDAATAQKTNNDPTPTNEKEEVMDAEMKAAKERATVPLEQRVKQFKEMLREKDVSAFSTWEKELHKIVFDPRYLLLTSRERKQVFERYVKDRAEEERREKRNKLRQKRDDFRSLMENASLHGKSSFDDFAKKYAKEEHFRAIEKMRERESLFNEYIVEVRKREKEEKHQKKEQVSTFEFSLKINIFFFFICDHDL